VFKIDDNLSNQFNQQPKAFGAFLKKSWNQVYFALFVFQLQPVKPGFHYIIIHAIPIINGKGASQIVSLLLSSKRQLETEFHFDVCGIAFDDDSCFNTLYHDFHLDWIDVFRGNPQMFPEISTRSVVISDPLHLMKRICDR
jgi:hypothetical protein